MLINITMKFSFFFSSQNIIYVHDKVYSVIYSMHITCIKALSLYKSVGLKILHKLLLWYTLVFADLAELKIKHCTDLYFRVIAMKNSLTPVCFYLLLSTDCSLKTLGN